MPTLEERRAFKALNPMLKSTVFGLLHENDLNLLVNESKHKRSKKKLDVTQPFDIGCLSTNSGMANYSLVEYTDESSDDEQLTPGIAVAMYTSSTPKKLFAPSARNQEIASPIRMPTATAISSNVTLNISATETSRNLSNQEPLVWSAAATSSKYAIEISEAGPSTNVNESAPAIPPITTNQEPLVWSAAATSSKYAIEISEAGPSTNVNESAPAIPPITTNQEPVVWSAAATSSKDAIATILVNDDVETPKTAPKKSRTPYRLSNEDAGVFVNEQVKFLLNFYTVDLNAKRIGPPLSQQTKDKLVERLYCFLFFCKRISNKLDLTLALCNDETLISEYVNYLSKVGELMPNTICVHLTTIINVVKYNHCDDWSALASCKALLTCRSFQRQLGREAHITSLSSKEGICMKPSSQKFYFNHILDTIRNLRAKIFSSTGIKKARYLHDFVMLSMYLRVNPGRLKEIRTLQVFVESVGNEFDVAQFLNENVIAFKNDKTVSLIEDDYKTVNSTGPRNSDLSEDEMLVYYLHQYNLARPTLLQAKSHNYFFLNTSGDPFKNSSSLCVSDGDEFELRPAIGDICALLDGASTADDVAFFIAKVARFTSDGCEAHLAKVEGSDALYRLAPGKVWKERIESLVYPIDIAYNYSEHAYELRTGAEDIYNAVKGT
jgi:hypothetical protein